jgi:hypothetical protein
MLVQRSEWISRQGESLPPKRPTRRLSTQYGSASNVDDYNITSSTHHLPPTFPKRRASICTDPNESKSVRFAPASISIKSEVITMTDDEISSYWWNADEIAYFYQRAWQSVQTLLAASNIKMNKTKMNAKTSSNLLWKKQHSQSLWKQRSKVLCRIYDVATELTAQNDQSYMPETYVQLLECHTLALANDWIGVDNDGCSAIGQVSGSSSEFSCFVGELAVLDSDMTPRGLEQHYLHRMNVHHAAEYRGKIIAYYRTRTYTDLQLAQVSQRDTLNDSIFARFMGNADSIAIANHSKLAPDHKTVTKGVKHSYSYISRRMAPAMSISSPTIARSA